jgi:hypothetical protein
MLQSRWIVLVIAALAACDLSSSATEFENSAAEMQWEDDVIRRHVRSEKMGLEDERGCNKLREHLLVQPRELRPIQPRAGCDGCPGRCAQFDLHITGPDAFARQFREQVRLMTTGDTDQRILADREMLRLMCLVKASGAPLEDRLEELMQDGERVMVRLHAGYRAMRHGFILNQHDRLHAVVDDHRELDLAVWCLIRGIEYDEDMFLDERDAAQPLLPAVASPAAPADTAAGL